MLRVLALLSPLTCVLRLIALAGFMGLELVTGSSLKKDLPELLC
jgi:hypothetical protein